MPLPIYQILNIQRQGLINLDVLKNLVGDIENGKYNKEFAILKGRTRDLKKQQRPPKKASR